jgi:hypothetical protein
MKIGEIGRCDFFALPKIGNTTINTKGILIDDINEIIFIGVNQVVHSDDPTMNVMIEIPYSSCNYVNFDSKKTSKLKNGWDKRMG